MKRTSRKPSTLSESLQRRLGSYALAASAAGVSLLALSQPAEGEITYTPANKILPNCEDNPRLCLKIDLNHDGIVDFKIPFKLRIKPYRTDLAGIWVENPGVGTAAPKNAIWGTLTSHGRAASALSSGVSVGNNSAKFSPQNNLMWASSWPYAPWGQWKDVSDGYLGFKFYIKGEAHYGWARFSAVGSREIRPTLTGYAYESIPNKPIVTGQTKDSDDVQLRPASLGRLAQGSAGRLGK